MSMTRLVQYVFAQHIDRGGPGMVPDWPQADPALTRFYLVADVEQFVETLAKGMYLRHRPECIGDRILTDCTCGLAKALASLKGQP